MAHDTHHPGAVQDAPLWPWLAAAVTTLLGLAAWTQFSANPPVALQQLAKWLATALGTVAGLLIGALSLSTMAPLRGATRVYVQVFRNAPVLVLVYFSTYVFPFELQLHHWRLPFPDWIKVVLGLALPASANVAEIFRGAVQSIPSAQWEAAQSLALSRRDIFRLVVLPQCVRRMLPPWMNLYASITMATSLASLVGVHDVVDAAQIASNTVSRTDFTVLIYATLLLLFFAYCYPIARATQALEARHARH